MPKIRKKFSEAEIANHTLMGPCLKVGSEIWFFQGKKLGMGQVEKITPGESVQIRNKNGDLLTLTPESSIVMAKALTEKQKKSLGI